MSTVTDREREGLSYLAVQAFRGSGFAGNSMSSFRVEEFLGQGPPFH